MSSFTKSKFDKFSRTDYIYTTVDGHDLWTSIFSPKPVGDHNSGHDPEAATQVPVLIFWHGGGFIVADRLYEPWWPSWLLALVLSQNALVVAPDYRLLPEASGADIVDDVDAFWTWFLDTVPVLAESESWILRPDFSRIICAGHSAGGSLALLSALERPDADVKAVVSLYGPLDSSVPELKISRPRMILGSWPPPPRQAEAAIRSYMLKTRGTTRSSGSPSEMWPLVACIMQQGRLQRMFLTRRPDPRLDTIATIEKRRFLPPIWIVHGLDDSVVPPACSTEFVRRVQSLVPGAPIVLSLRPGEHNFDASLTRDEPWIAEGCEFLLKYW
jgi:acetyl esterase/lipase